MRNAKKILSILIAAVLLLSSVSVASFALTAENADYANVKYSVNQTNTIVVGGEEFDLTGTEHEGLVYALTISVKAAKGVSYLQIPYYYNMDKFGQITLYDGTDMYYAYNGYYSDMGENAVYDVYKLGPAWSDAGQYKADGTAAANAMQTKAFGLAHSSVAGAYTIVTNIVDPTTIGYDLWTAGISKEYTVGCGYFTISNTFAKNKSAYINSVNGKVVADEYVDIMTVYLYNFDGEAEGEEIGAYADWEKDSVNNIQVTWCTTLASGIPMNGHINNTSKYGSSWASFVENDVIEAAAVPTSIVNPMKGQIRFDKNENGGYAGTFDVRAIARITGTDFDATFGSIADAEANIASVGFVFAQGSGDYEEMKAVAQAGASGNGYTYAPVDFISTSFDPGNYTFSCIVDNVDDKNDSLVALAYVKYVDADGATQWAFYTDVQTVPFAGLYDTYYGEVFGA